MQVARYLSRAREHLFGIGFEFSSRQQKPKLDPRDAHHLAPLWNSKASLIPVTPGKLERDSTRGNASVTPRKV